MFLVMGKTGEYEDHRTWVVAGFTTRRRASTWARKANEWAAANGLDCSTWSRRHSLPSNPWDAHMSVDYTGVSYFITGRIPLDPPRPR